MSYEKSLRKIDFMTMKNRRDTENIIRTYKLLRRTDKVDRGRMLQR